MLPEKYDFILSAGFKEAYFCITQSETRIACACLLMSRDEMPLMLLLSTLTFGVATIPSIFALAAEILALPPNLATSSSNTPNHDETHFSPVNPSVALWLLPFAWIWPAAWQASASGDLILLYNLVLLPVTVALGLRALQANQRVWPALFLAAIPLTLGGMDSQQPPESLTEYALMVTSQPSLYFRSSYNLQFQCSNIPISISKRK